MGADILAGLEAEAHETRFRGLDVSGRRLVVFDFDGTLADTLGGITSTAARVLVENHHVAPEDLGDLSRLVGPPFPQAFSLVYGLSPEEAEQVTAEYRAVYRTLGAAGWPLFDGIADLLRRLRAAGKLVAVASSKQQALIDRALADEGATGLFDLACGKRDDLTDPKDLIIARVMARLGCDASQTVMVGDRKFDVAAASANDIPCVGVTYGRTSAPGELEAAGACAVAHTVDELGRVLLGGR